LLWVFKGILFRQFFHSVFFLVRSTNYIWAVSYLKLQVTISICKRKEPEIDLLISYSALRVDDINQNVVGQMVT